MATDMTACMVSIEIDSRQRYLFETDKWQEILGASRLIARTRKWAKDCFTNKSLYVVQPLSGEIRAWAPIERRTDLLAAAWEFRLELARVGIEHTCGYLETRREHFEKGDQATRRWMPDDTTKDTDPEAPPALGAVHQRMTRRVSGRKAVKTGVEARPWCSLFAPCRLHPYDFADKPAATEQVEPDELRRRQRGFRARMKWEAWRTERGAVRSQLIEEVQDLGMATPTMIQHLEQQEDFAEALDRADGQQDQYVALLCADGDGIGSRILPAIDWNDATWGDQTPAERNVAFVEALDRCIGAAFRRALVGVPWTHDDETQIPAMVQLLGGDDFWVLARRDVALDLATKFSQYFTDLSGADEVLQRARQVIQARTGTTPVLTISVGVAFVKSGHPIHASVSAAETLLTEAKRRRRGEAWPGHPVGEGCLDWHRIESSLSENVLDARRTGLIYRSPGPKPDAPADTMALTTRPWTRTEYDAMVVAKEYFDQVPRRKQEQLEDILRRGRELSLLGWEDWWKGLRDQERQAVRDANEKLPAAWSSAPPAGEGWDVSIGPWFQRREASRVYETAWLDLVALGDVTGRAFDQD
jgi:GGDEF domain-containing protein